MARLSLRPWGRRANAHCSAQSGLGIADWRLTNVALLRITDSTRTSELLKSSLLLQRISPCNFSLRNTKRFCSRGLFFRAGFRWPVNCRLLGRGLIKRYRPVFDGLNAHWAGEYKLTTGHMR
jgi:hypothetical protein